MPQHLSLSQLFEDNREKLLLNWVNQLTSMGRPIELKTAHNYGADVVGHINTIHPERLQVMGQAEYDWALAIGKRRFSRVLKDLFSVGTPAMIVADGLTPPQELTHLCEKTRTPLILTPKHCSAVIDLLRMYLAAHLADSVSLHGVFMEVYGLGVLLTGDSGIGKSELALELISRGHGLVADDIVEMARIAPDFVEGRCPEMLRDFLEVRGLGLLNIRTIYGESSVRHKMRLTLIVHLQQTDSDFSESRLSLGKETQDIAGVPILKTVLRVAAGRNLAVLVEAAVLNTLLKMRGKDTAQELINRQAEQIEKLKK